MHVIISNGDGVVDGECRLKATNAILETHPSDLYGHSYLKLQSFYMNPVVYETRAL